MKLSDYLTSDRVVVLRGTSKTDALRELAEIVSRGNGLDAAKVERAIWERERLMSTGIGNGLAIPHVRLAGLSAPRIAVGVAPAGIADYDSLDGQPVCILVLILAPQGQHDTHIRLLARVADVLKHPQQARTIVAAQDPQLIYQILVGESA